MSVEISREINTPIRAPFIGATRKKIECTWADEEESASHTVAKRKTLFDDRPVEINELTYVIKQDLSALNSKISSLQSLTKSQASSRNNSEQQEGEHNKNVVVLLQGKLADVGVNFKEVLEVRTKNLQASRSRQQNFLSDVSDHTAQRPSPQQQSASPLYHTPTQSRTPQPPGYQNPNHDILNLDPGPTTAAGGAGGANGPGLAPASDNQLLLMEEAQPTNTYINMRGEAIDMIERTINELGGVFGQLAAMVSEQGEQIQRIDANTEDVVDNVQGAQRELMKYWSRVSGNRWLIAKMFGVLMVSYILSLSPPLFFWLDTLSRYSEIHNHMLTNPIRSSSSSGSWSPADLGSPTLPSLPPSHEPPNLTPIIHTIQSPSLKSPTYTTPTKNPSSSRNHHQQRPAPVLSTVQYYYIPHPSFHPSP